MSDCLVAACVTNENLYTKSSRCLSDFQRSSDKQFSCFWHNKIRQRLVVASITLYFVYFSNPSYDVFFTCTAYYSQEASHGCMLFWQFSD